MYDDKDDDEEDSEGGATDEERAFRCKLIADEFQKRRKVIIAVKVITLIV